jgi:hypothetical protein
MVILRHRGYEHWMKLTGSVFDRINTVFEAPPCF